MRTTNWIPEVVIQRLPIYLRALTHFEAQKIEVVSSQELGDKLHLTAAQIRKDLSYFGRFGKQGRGYNVKRLLQELQRILGLGREWPMALVGVGRLGRAIMGYAGFAPQGFRIVAAFDTDPAQMGKKVGNLVVQDMGQLPRIIRQQGIQIGIVAVPPSQAQTTIDALVKCGVRSILNYAPISARVPDGIKIRDIDPVLSLQSMTYYLKE
jgi:redox-sensing transcriptional repressor